MKQSKRDFLKKLGAMSAGTGLLSVHPLLAGELSNEQKSDKAKTNFKVTIFQTTDVHCQIHEHDELFWENGQAVFRKTGGYANLDIFIKKQRAKCEHSFLVDTGDMFQGSMLSIETSGQAMVPLLNELQYDLYLPGNWEVIYAKAQMQNLLGSLHGPKVCANMYHDLGDGKKGELIFPPYYIWNIDGVKIGFLGYNDPMIPLRQSPNYSKGIYFTKPE